MLHHHVRAFAIMWFLIGYALHVLVQLNDVAKKQQTPMVSMLKDRWVSVLVRGFISLAIFIGIMNGQIDDLINSMGVPLPMWLDKLLGLQVDQGWLAGLIGYAFDSALYYIPALQKIGVPPPVEAPTTPAPAPGPIPAPPPATKGTK